MFDTSFGQEGHVLTSITGGADAFEDVIELSNGKYLAAARFRQSQNSERYIGAIRYMQNGEIDKTFGVDGIVKIKPEVADQYIYQVLELADGKIILAGYCFYIDEAETDAYLVRLNADGSIDKSFGTDGVAKFENSQRSLVIEQVAEQADGKLIIMGTYFRSFMAARVNKDGSLDTSFGTEGTGYSIVKFPEFSSSCENGLILPNGKIALVGFRKPDTNTQKPVVVMLNADGTPDTSYGTEGNGTATFYLGAGPDYAVNVAAQKDGKLVLVGHSWQSNEPNLIYSAAIFRVGTDGKLDTSFGEEGIVTKLFDPSCASLFSSVSIAEDGKIYAAGNTEKGAKKEAIGLCLNPDGSYDKEFAHEGWFKYVVKDHDTILKSVKTLKDGNILMAGYALDLTVQMSQCYLTRMLKKTATSIETIEQETAEIKIYPNPTSDYLELEEIASPYSAKIIDMAGRTVYAKKAIEGKRIELRQLNAGNYILQLESNGKLINKHFVKQ